jgi:hypothetical protein
MYVEYSSNNSGGHWWMKDEDWKALERAGWIVVWASLAYKYTPEGSHERDESGMPVLIPVSESKDKLNVAMQTRDANGVYRYMGALAKTAFKPNCNSLREAADEFDALTSCTATDAGCACCGQPHTFTLYDDKGEYVVSGPTTSYEASW